MEASETLNQQMQTIEANVRGVQWSVAAAGIKTDRNDLALMAIAPGANTVAVTTQNAFCAAPVQLMREHIKLGSPRYILINAGNANAGTGEAGISASLSTCRRLSELAGVDVHSVLPCSTGVIGELLPSDQINAVLPEALESLTDTWDDAAKAIMTTDTKPKSAARSVIINGKTVLVKGIAKGAGMIKPNMATMLAYVATDAEIEKSDLQKFLNDAVSDSFNRITVDGDTSTNDVCTLTATGISSTVRYDSGEAAIFAEALNTVMQSLAMDIIRDAEGATKFITIDVQEGADTAECLQVAYTVAESPLVKTAFFASDANWGRILAAVGRAGLQNLNPDNVKIYLNDLLICEHGARAKSYTEILGRDVMSQQDIAMRIVLGRGNSVARVWTSDLSHDYVRINAEYRT